MTLQYPGISLTQCQNSKQDPYAPQRKEPDWTHIQEGQTVILKQHLQLGKETAGLNKPTVVEIRMSTQSLLWMHNW